MKNIQNKLGTYLAVTAGVGCAASVAEASTTVTFFEQGEENDFGLFVYGNGFSGFVYSTIGDLVFRSDFNEYNLSRSTEAVEYQIFPFITSFANGAVPGDQNFISFSENADDSSSNGVAQFFFDGVGGGFLVSTAVGDVGSTLSLADGIAAINGDSVPEPSSLALLALGATGIAARRRRKQAA